MLTPKFLLVQQTPVFNRSNMVDIAKNGWNFKLNKTVCFVELVVKENEKKPKLFVGSGKRKTLWTSGTSSISKPATSLIITYHDTVEEVHSEQRFPLSLPRLGEKMNVPERG